MNNSIYPCLWFDNDAATAAVFYQKVFNANVIEQNEIVVQLSIFGQQLMLLNGGAVVEKNASVSLMVICHSEDELDGYWNALSNDGAVLMELGSYPFADKYGWVRDKFGMTWQFYFRAGYTTIQQMVPTLMFVNENNGKAKLAMDLYTHIFPDSSIEGIMLYKDGGEKDVPENVQHAEFVINGYKLACMDTSLVHPFDFSEGVSMVIITANQEETDYYWYQLIANGGKESQCGWLKDKFGLSWQIVPADLMKMIGDTQHPDKAQKAMQAMLAMKRIDIVAIEATYNS